MDIDSIIAELKSDITEAQAALRYFEKKRAERTVELPLPPPSPPSRTPVAMPSAPASSMEQRSIPDMVLGLLRSDPGHEWSVSEIIAGVSANEKSLRGALNRLAKDGRIARASRGRYQLKPNEAEVQRIVA